MAALPTVDRPPWTAAELYRRGCATLLASWEEYARAATGATVRRLPGVAAAVFPDGPERAVYNGFPDLGGIFEFVPGCVRQLTDPEVTRSRQG